MARETSLEERQRKDAEKADAIKKRQIRLGHVKAETAETKEVQEEKVVPKRSRAKQPESEE